MPLLFLLLSGIAVAAMAVVGSSRRIAMRAGEVWTLDFAVTTSGMGEEDPDLAVAIAAAVTALGSLAGLGIPLDAKPFRNRVLTVVVRPMADVTIDLGQSFRFPIPTKPGATITVTLQGAARAPAG